MKSLLRLFISIRTPVFMKVIRKFYEGYLPSEKTAVIV